jgi:hypothetical protein
MAIIYSYPEKTTPAGGDFLVITDSEQPAPNKNRTKSLTIDNLANYVVTSTSGITGSGTLNTIAMFTPDGQKIGDSIITQASLGQAINVNTNLFVSDDLSVTGSIETNSGLTVTEDATFSSTITAGGGTGTAGQVLSSTGTGVEWVDNIATAAEVVEVPVKNLQGSALIKGDPVYISGSVGASGRLEVQLADASIPAKMPALGLLKQDLGINEEGSVVVTGKLRNLITSPIDGQTPLANDIIYVKPGSKAGAALTLTKPTGSNLIQNMGKVGRVSTSNDGTFVVSSILRTNDVPNLTTGRIWVGSAANTIESQAVFIDEANNRLGVNTATPVTNLHVQGGIRITGGVDLFQQHENAFAGTNAGNQGTIIGAFNAAFGKNAMAAALSASNNTAVGYNALNTITGGNNNVTFGSGAGSSILNGSFNVALGASALPAAINTQSNIAIGYNAQESNTSGNNNIAIGKNALGTMSTNFSNTVIGTDAAKLTTSMNKAVVIGSEALGAGTAGSDVVLVGNQAGQNNFAQWTVAIGSRALQTNVNGAFNTAVGGQALSAVTGGIGRQNVGLGYQAGNNITTGQNDIVIGFQAQASSATANNEITLGNSSISVLRCAVTTITSLSDERDKTDITNLEYGLDFINSLSPKQFTWNQRPEHAIEIDEEGNETQVEVENANKGKKDFGFIAQEVQSVDNDILRLIYAENPEKLEMSYGKLVPILVQAIKELTNRIEALEA